MSDSGNRPSHPKSETRGSASESRVWLFVALFSAILAATPLLVTPGLVSTRGGGDSPFLLIRTYELAQGLRAGQFPVRWMDQAAYGLGYPFFSFYAALPYYLAALLHLGGLGILWSLKLTQLTGFLGAAAGMYALARRWLKAPPAAALATIAYTFAPFHLVNVYVRGDSLSEFYAFVWYPLILLGLHRLFERPSVSRAGALAVACAALLVTHNLSAMIFSPFVLTYALLLIFGRSVQKEGKTRAIALTLLALALAALLSAWYWLPLIGEIDEVQLGEEQTGGHFHYSAHFRRWDLVQPTAWFDYDPDAEPTPYAMGLVQAALALAGMAALLWRWLGRRHATAPDLFALLTLAATTLMLTPLSRPLWDNLPLLPLVQFPWRFLSVQALATGMIAGHLATVLPRPRAIAGLAGLALAIAALAGLRPEPLHITDADVSPERLAWYEYVTANIGTTIQAEYLPRHVVPRPYASEALLAIPSRPPPTALEGSLGSAALLEGRSDRQRWQVDVTSDAARLAFHTLYFPGWQAQVDGHPVEVTPWPGLGYMALSLERGLHEVLLHFGNSPIRQGADLATTAGLFILLALGVAARPWQRLARHHFWLAGGILIVALVCGILLRLPGSPPARPGPSDLTMDFIRQPYLHHNPMGVDFGTIRLLGYTMSADLATAGETIALQIAWSDDGQEELTGQVDLVLAVHEDLEDPPLLATSTSAIPLEGGLTHHQIAIPDDVVRGLYFLRVRVIGQAGLLQPRTAQGKALGHTYLRPLQVTAHRAATGDEPALGQFGPHIALMRAQVEPASTDRLAVRLTWRCQGPVPINYRLSLRLSGQGKYLVQYDPPLRRMLYPTSLWRPGELVTERHALALPAGVTADQAQTLEVVLYDYASPTLTPIGVAYVPVQERPRRFEIPPMGARVGAEFGGQMRLLGYDLAQSADALTLTLHWQAMQVMAADYKVFVHLFDPATEAILVQDDAMPLRNTYPTRWWASSEVVSDAIPLPLANVPAGQYRLAVGVYEPPAKPRLKAVDGQGHPLFDNRLVLSQEIPLP